MSSRDSGDEAGYYHGGWSDAAITEEPHPGHWDAPVSPVPPAHHPWAPPQQHQQPHDQPSERARYYTSARPPQQPGRPPQQQGGPVPPQSRGRGPQQWDVQAGRPGPQRPDPNGWDQPPNPHPHSPMPEAWAPQAPAPRQRIPYPPQPQSPYPPARHPQAPHGEAAYPQAPRREAAHPQAPHREAPHPQAPHRAAPHPQSPYPPVGHPQSPHQEAAYPQAPHRAAPHPQSPYPPAGHPPQQRPPQQRPPQQRPPQQRPAQPQVPQQRLPQQQQRPPQQQERPPQQQPVQPAYPRSDLVRTPQIPPPPRPGEAQRAPRPDETFIIEPITMPHSRQAARMALRHSTWKPGILSGLVPFLVVLVLSWWLAQPGHGPLGWVLTVLWSWPIISSLVGIYGALNTRIHLRQRRKYVDEAEAFRCNDLLVVVVPTIGRHDTYPALERSVLSYVHHLPSCFPQLRIDVITEEGCEAHERIKLLAARSPLIRVVTVPKAYTTKNGTRFKARANHYSHELRIAEGEARDDVWVLHMDDDTGVAMDTAVAMAHFIERQRWAGEDARHLAQGILTYPRENAVNMLTWLADAVRPADDIARFAAFTGAGTPLSGLHGELLLVRASIEATIGWDFGPKAIVEDAQLALTFCRRYPGRSAWFQGRCYGASPATVRDFVKQRERWAWGLVGLATNRTIPLRHRIFLGYSVVSWVAGPLQHVAVVLLVGAALGDMNTTPVSMAILPLWAINMGYTVWMYMEGLKINARVSENGRRRWWEPIAVLCLIPVFSLMEGIGGFLGFLKWLRRAENKFVVIAKPA